MAQHTPRSDDRRARRGFWQIPFVQNGLPFLTSLSAHIAIVVIGILLVRAIPALVKPSVEPPIAQNAPIIDNGQNGSDSLHLGSDPNKDVLTQQDQIEVPDTRGISVAPVKGTQIGLMKDSDPSDMSDIIVGPNSGRYSTGHGGPGGAGGDTDNPMIAPFGPPQTGGGQHPGIFVNPPGDPRGARSIVFVCDATGSMMSQFDTLREQMQQSIRDLSPAQYYSIIFFQSPNESHAAEFISMSPEVLRATPEVKKRGDDFVENVTARGGTNPIPAFKAALAMHPDLIWFLVDPGDFESKPELLKIAREMNADHKTRINTIAFFGRNDQDEAFLQQMAKENGGAYRLVEKKDLNP